MKSHWQILVVDDEMVMRESMAAWLREDGYTVDTAGTGSEAIQLARQKSYAICFVDLKMPGGMDGIETMMEIRKLQPDAAVIIITAYATVDTAITAMKEGAQEYIVKPCNPEEISLLVERIIKIRNLQRENQILRKKLTRQYHYHDIITKSPRMQEVLELTKEVASYRSTVLIRGESGTGKELVARAVHFSGDRAEKPFITVSCAALTETLLESELFGHEKGSFTGAAAQTKGKFELASGGTIFLDEIGDISPKLQADLLRVLQEKRFYRVGGTQEVSVDARVIAATNRDLAEEVRQGRFRDDLYYRLNVIEIRLPPLRERREDIPLLAEHFVERIARELGKDIGGVSEDALKALMDYDWPGNVRELENAVERAVVSCRNHVLTSDNLQFLVEANRSQPVWTIPPETTLQELERKAIIETLQRTRGNIKESASILGIDRSTLYEKIRRYDIPRGETVAQRG
ncbi:MAG: sigma-54-dependent Fis family transcriptional regulator [Bryobacterales bacterium]|nr:sigma-54-dependent Fis family transcriptional regulator [Bryobacterales bacterium]